MNGKYRVFSPYFGKAEVPTLVAASAGHTINVDFRATAKQVFDSAEHPLPDFVEHATFFGAIDGILADGCLKPGGGRYRARPVCASTRKMRRGQWARWFSHRHRCKDRT